MQISQTLLIIAFILGAIIVTMLSKIVTALLPVILLSLPAWSDLFFNHYDLILKAINGDKNALKSICTYANPINYWDKFALTNVYGSFIMIFAYISFIAYIFRQKLGIWSLSWFLASVLVWFSGCTLPYLSSTLRIPSLLLLLIYNIPSIAFLIMKR